MTANTESPYTQRSRHQLAGKLLTILKHHGWRLATAESCTGGMVGEYLTAIPGISAVYVGGIIAYANEVKRHWLGIPPAILDTHGAVSAETAAAMARGISTRFMVETGIAITGIAGPDGGTIEKPVGLVYISTIINDDIQVRCIRFSGSRQVIRKHAAATALRHLLERLR